MALKDQVYWYTLHQPQIAPLERDLSVDLAVVGGGMAGLMCAQQARDRGLKVAILEAQYCGAGASGKSSGFITPDSELELSDLIADYGPSRAKELWEFVSSGCEAIRKNILDYQLNCDYQVQDSLFVANQPKGQTKVKREHEARHNLHYESTWYGQNELKKVLGSDNYYGGVRYPGTFGIIAYLYCQQLKDRLVENGVQIFEHTPVTKISDHTLETPQGKIAAHSIIFCADYFLSSLGIVPKDVYHAQTFLSLSQPLPVQDRELLFPDAPVMVWDTDLIYQYFRLTGEGRLLLGGASPIYTYSSTEQRAPVLIIKKLQRYLASKFPQIKFDLEYFWPGFIGVSKDFLPVAGPHHELPDVYYIGGAAGLPWAAALGRYLANKIAGDRSATFDSYFKTPRDYPVPYALQSVLGKPITFAVSHGLVKYFK